jgi:MarR family transcriptional regulator for hemolysin
MLSGMASQKRSAQLIHAAARRLDLAVAEALLPFELTPAQFVVLEALRRLPTPAIQIDLANAVGVRQPTMAATISRMERDGWLITAADPDDRRRVHIRLTTISQRRFRKAAAAKKAAETHVLRDLTDTDVEDLDRILSRLG